jgi:hypothetical protein
MNSRQREARRTPPSTRYGHLTNQAIGTMCIVDGAYHLFINDGVKIRETDIDHATYEVVREVDGFLAELKVLIPLPAGEAKS